MGNGLERAQGKMKGRNEKRAFDQARKHKRDYSIFQVYL
jgi:hypothetical protein